MTFTFQEENRASRARLEAVVAKLTPEAFARTSSSGWTVSALLAHLAYWDQRVLALLRRWQENGVDESPVDADAVNEALKPLCLKLDPAAAVELCLSAAQEIDQELETISEDLVSEIQASPNHFRFNRALHRSDHLNEIEQLLKVS